MHQENPFLVHLSTVTNTTWQTFSVLFGSVWVVGSDCTFFKVKDMKCTLDERASSWGQGFSGRLVLTFVLLIGRHRLQNRSSVIGKEARLHHLYYLDGMPGQLLHTLTYLIGVRLDHSVEHTSANMMKLIRPQFILLFLAGITAVASQQVDPDPGTVNNTSCSSIPFDVLQGVDVEDKAVHQLPFIEECLSSVPVDKENMIKHITALNEVFAHAFYNVARDPAAGGLQEYQAELGFSLFDSADEGRVDINAELTSIIESVEEEGASWATFWDVQSVLNRLRDGHVTMPKTAAGDLSFGYVFFIPDRCADGKITGRHSISNDPVTGELQLKIHRKDDDGMESESVLESMNGSSPYDFFLNVSNSPSISGINYQSRGARFNALLMKLTEHSRDLAEDFGDGENSKAILPVFVNARPSDAYPPEVQVKYADGEEERYRTFLFPTKLNIKATTGTTMSLTEASALLQENINKPGNVYVQLEQVAQSITTWNRKRAAPRTRSQDDDVASDAENETFWEYEYPEDNPEVAFKIMDGYAIFKVESFDGLEPASVIINWIGLCKVCKLAGIKKVIVDISNNGGGTTESSPTLATLMYPTAAHTWYRKNRSVVINKPMQIYRDKLEPEFKLFNNLIMTIADNGMDEIFQNYFMDILTDDRIEKVNDAIVALKDLCERRGLRQKCGKIDDLERSWKFFAAYKSPPLFRLVVQDMVDVLTQFNRFYDLERGEMDFDGTSFQTVNLGGVVSNLTNPFTIFFNDLYYEAVASALQNDPGFDEYIKVELLWKNRDKTGVTANLTTVSYGGLKEGNGDVTMAGAPATVREIFIEDSFIASGVATLLDSLTPELVTEFRGFDSALHEYYESIADPPYFANTLPRLPVTGYYETPFMGPGAMATQYIKMPAKKHIPSYYLDTTIQDNNDLEELYMKTAGFFSSDSTAEDGDGDEVENSTAGDDAPKPKPISENYSSEEGSGSDPKTASDPPSTASAVTSGVVGTVVVAAAVLFSSAM
eukprot:scaffold9862_cov149-Skeletonema_dohrnii-CCMP3373.AAC.4